MADQFVGEVRLFGFAFPPVDWVVCDGGLLSIADYSLLFQLIGTTYGGDGQSTFAVPDLRGRLPIGYGRRPAAPVARQLGERGGSEQAQLTGQQLPPHVHGTGTSVVQTTTRPGVAARGGAYAASGTDGTAGTTSAGGGTSIDVTDPYQVGNFCIAVQGIFPTQT